MKPPRHPGHWLLGSLNELRPDPLKFFTKLHCDYGDVSIHRVGPFDYHFVTHPDGVKRILQDNHPNYTKRVPDFRAVGYLTGAGVLTTDGQEWMRRRRLMQPAFHRDRIREMMLVMARLARQWLDDLRATRGEAINATEAITRLTMRIATMTLFSLDLDARAREVMDAFTLCNEILIRRFRAGRLFPPIFVFADDRAFQRQLRRFDQIVDEIIRDHRRNPDQSSPDLLSMLMGARDEEDGGFLSDLDLRAEVKTLLLAGFETTSNALGWSFYRLGRHPELADELRTEVRTVMGDAEFAPSMIEALPRLRSFFEEVMRLYPPAWFTARRAEKADVICGYELPAGARVSVSPYVVHRHPDFWPNPAEFDATRFLPGRREGAHRFSYFPFGGGPRQCIGNQFGMAEALIILAHLVRDHRVELVSDAEPEPFPLITLRMKHDLQIRLQPATTHRHL